MTRRLVGMSVLALLMTATPSLAQPPPAAKPAQGVRPKLTGVVVDEEDKPVAGAVVVGFLAWTYDRGSTHGEIAAQTTNEKGEFAVECGHTVAGLTAYVRARHGAAFTAGAAKVAGGDLAKPLRLTISPKNACAVSLRVVDPDGQPIPGAAVTARHEPSTDPTYAHSVVRPVKWPDRSPAASDAGGKFTSARALDPDGRYKLTVTADGFLEQATPWTAVGKGGLIAFGDVVLTRLRPLEGAVVDRQGRPVAGAKVTHTDDRQRNETTTDAAGRFSLKTTFFPPGFLFVEKDGYRFHGQRCEKPNAVTVALTRRDEPPQSRMTSLPPALPLAKRKELAGRVLEPTLKVLEKGSDDERLRPLERLAGIDPGRALEELERRPLKEAWYDGYVRRAVVKALRENHEEARTVVDSIKDAGFRVHCYLDLCDALPAGKKAGRLDCLNQALLAARADERNDHRVLSLGRVGRRLHDLGEKERAAKLLREAEAVAKELPTAGWAGYARGAFAEDLGSIDVPAALALMKDLKDPFEHIRHHANLAVRLGATSPAEAERVLNLGGKGDEYQRQFQRDQYAVRVCHRMAPADLARARKLAASIKNDEYRARALVVMADALAKGKPKEALGLLDKAFALLAKQAASNAEPVDNFSTPASAGGLALSAAERIDPGLVPEFFWRALSLHHPRRSEREPEYSRVIATAPLALTLSRYDRDVARALIGAAGAPTDDRRNSITLLQAAALADPARAAAMLDKVRPGRDGDYPRSKVAAALLAEGESLARLLHSALAMWYVDDEDL